VTCPKCGWDVDDDARFCPICLSTFDKSKKLDLVALNNQVRDNPLTPSRNKKLSGAVLGKLSGLPTNAKWAVLGTLIIILLMIIFGR
jgi:uncharacterized membrane protein YvbJ